MDQVEFERLLKNIAPPAAAPMGGGPEGAQPVDPMEAIAGAAEQLGLTPAAGRGAAMAAGPTALDAEGRRPDGTPYDQPPAEEPGLGDASGLDAVAGGAAKAVFETKDFLFGDTPEEDRSEFRANVEDTVKLRGEQSMLDGFSATAAQFITAMIGLGKVKALVEALPWVGAGLSAVEASRKGAVAVEAGKAAMAGAIAFDPHEERLSNAIQDTPLANPLNAWLAADPDDGAAEGRMKAALESIGMDAVLLGTFMGAGKVWKHLRKGETDKAGAEVARIEAEANKAIADEETASAIPPEQQAVPPTPAADAGGSEVPEAGTLREPEAVPAEAQGGPAETVEPPTAQAGAEALQPAPETAPQPPSAALDDTVEVQAVNTPTEAKEAAGAPTPSPSSKPRVDLSDEDTAAVLEGMEADAAALYQSGDWYKAIEEGHTFGKGAGIPYQKLNSDDALDAFMARVIDASEERLDAIKGGDVLSDERVERLVRQRAKLFDDDPALLVGMIQKAGRDASHMVAEMEASYLVANRLFQDAYALGVRVNMGDLTAFGGNKLAAQEELRKRLSLAASVYGAAKSMSSNSGRALRRMRSEFKIDPEAIGALRDIDGDALMELVAATKGDPRNLGKLTSVPLLRKAVDFLGFLYVNNLVSGPMTQFINMATNAYMLGVRPLERIIGSVVMDAAKGTDSRAILRDSTRQYVYMGAAFSEGFRNGVRAFLKNDSILSPHKVEVYAGNTMGQASGFVRPFKPWNSIPNLLYNTTLSLPAQALGMPTRVLGSVDEVMRQTTYRSKVMAGAYWEAVDKGTKAGLTDQNLEDFVKQYVRDKTDMAFDSEGRGINANALNEANIATFQQDLLPGTMGKWFQTGVVNHPGLRLVLPFVKTPANVLRYGWKMSPGLNMLQAEYRDMLWGKMGEEAQRQAVGQFTLGSLFVGSAAFMASSGRITGAGPRQQKLRAELMATGWRPYSVVSKGKDGAVTYVPFGRYDPIAIPFGIIADLQDVIAAQPEDADTSQLEAYVGALQIAVASQVRNKTYLMGIAQAGEAFMDPERASFFGQAASNAIPFSAAQRQFNTDPYLREARDLTDRLMATVPGLSEKVPPRYDAWGDPVTVRKGLWSNSEYDVVDREVARLALENGATITTALPRHNGIDLRDITLSDGRNAYATYQQMAGHLPGRNPSLKAVIKRVIESAAYRKAPDGAADVRGTKLWLLHEPVSRYRAAALRMLKRDPVVRDAFTADKRKVAQFYRTQKEAAQSGAASMEDIGDAFGVDLGAPR